MKYKIYIKGLKKGQRLIFLDSFDSAWNLYLENNLTKNWCNKAVYNKGEKVFDCGWSQEMFKLSDLSFLFKPTVFSKSHKIYNGYANQWYIDASSIKNNYPPSFYKSNPDGSIDLELTMFFVPQDYFYIATFISVLSLVILTIVVLKKEYI